VGAIVAGTDKTTNVAKVMQESFNHSVEDADDGLDEESDDEDDQGDDEGDNSPHVDCMEIDMLGKQFHLTWCLE